MATGPITAIEGIGGNQAPPVRARTEVLARERDAVVSSQTANAVAASSSSKAPVHISTRVALDPKTLRAYIQTVADEPTEQVIHSYPTPRSTADTSTLIILA